MKIFLGQVYVQAGVNYPFSHQFQKWMSEVLSGCTEASKKYIEVYGADFNLIFRLSAKANIPNAEVKGPTVFKKTKDVEYTIFLPHEGSGFPSPPDYSRVLSILFDSIIAILEELEVDVTKLVNDAPDLIKQIVSNPTMFKKQ